MYDHEQFKGLCYNLDAVDVTGMDYGAMLRLAPSLTIIASVRAMRSIAPYDCLLCKGQGGVFYYVDRQCNNLFVIMREAIWEC